MLHEKNGNLQTTPYHLMGRLNSSKNYSWARPC